MPQGCSFLAVLGVMGTEGRAKGLWGALGRIWGGGRVLGGCQVFQWGGMLPGMV